ncbi:MAG TPA: macro domain-containing protein [Firmicutes bacterium]|jgi:O-acetyl-ADP-ribose deacetylase (regulator of RNase III)|nr:macro domain-containing protein [Bacillota bacterium]HHT43528.1 macro domain-containing protein [Bacillota bacterium]
MPFGIVRQDITTMQVDAIVNAANTSLARGGGVCGAIFQAAGPEEMDKACQALAPIRVGEAVITPGFHLPAKYVIHTAGPIYQGGTKGEPEQLRSSYLNSLRLAVENHCSSIAFPLISSGVYGYPRGEALRIATEAIGDFLVEHDLDIYLAVLNRQEIQVRGNLVEGLNRRLAEIQAEQERILEPLVVYSHLRRSLLVELDEPFTETLFRLIDAKGKTDVEVYKKANLDRRLFSKIRSDPGYVPSKRTVLALAIGLELTIEETHDLLRRAGYALSPSQALDVIVEYFIISRRYDIFEINEVLFSYDQPLLGSVGKHAED